MTSMAGDLLDCDFDPAASVNSDPCRAALGQRVGSIVVRDLPETTAAVERAMEFLHIVDRVAVVNGRTNKKVAA
jgi:hypothetical protein